MRLPRSPSFRIDDRRVLVVGTARGIGPGFAIVLAEAGAHVIMAVRRRERLDER